MARTLPDVIRCDWPADQPEPPPATAAALDRAAKILRRGGLVAIPTETVYGLAADALDEDAVAGIFRAKGRPASNPLIVHVADEAMARSLAGGWPEPATAIAVRHWPGPVTLVVPRGPRIPAIVTAGGATVAMRCPEHRLARRLIAVLGRPLAAPSANRSEELSPTTAQHVLAGLGSKVELILDGGPCERGIESTVVDCTTDPPRILRPGPLSREAVATAVGTAVVWPDPGPRPRPDAGGETARSPGQSTRHYAPQTPLETCENAADRVAELLAAGRRVGWLTTRIDDPAVRTLASSRDLVVVPMPADPDAYAARLYATLHALDQRELDRIAVETPPDTDAGRAVRDRRDRAAARQDESRRRRT
ncbi:MAG: L-threonylcarbamoyladenylate synthase [Planctomycetia bacterium]